MRAMSGGGPTRGRSGAGPRLRTAVAIAAAALLLLVPVLINGFPFIFPDSGDYLVFTPHLHRSPYYGLFIWFFHLDTAIWLPVVVQAVLTAHLLWLLLVLEAGPAAGMRALLPIAAVLTALSSLPWFVGFLMADLFTALMVLLLYILAMHGPSLGRWLRGYLLLLAAVATAAHVGNLTLALVLLPVLAMLLSLRGCGLSEVLRRLGLVLVPLALTAAALLTYFGVIHGILSVSPAGPVFLMANLVEHGPARRHLSRVCPDAGYRMCRILPVWQGTANAFLWETGQLQSLGGFAGMRQEAGMIVAATVAEHPGAVVSMVVDNSLRALGTRAPGAELHPHRRIVTLPPLIAGKFGDAAREAMETSLQWQGRLPRRTLARIDAVVFPAAAAVLLWVMLRWRRKPGPASLAMFVACAFLANLVLCATVSGVHDRYQARLSWTVVFAAAVGLVAASRQRPADTPATDGYGQPPGAP